MLLGRAKEIARIDRALAEARLGRGAALLIEGEPGIGKTELLAHAAGSAGDMTVISARGVQFEADVPYAGLHELLRPALGSLDRLPAPQVAALRSSLGLGERIEADRLVIGAATLGLLSALAELKPLLVLVDDAQWLDRASAEALAFAARRLGADPVAMLIAVRSDEESAVVGAGLPSLHVEGLDDASAAELLKSRATEPLAPDSVTWILEATGGNPLALLELGGEAGRLTAPAGDTPLPIATSVERAYLRRAAHLSAETRRAMVLLAASGTAEAGEAFEAAVEAVGLVALRHGRLEFVHPLARAAIYHAASPADRRAAHRALAYRMTAPDDVDRRAWHLAAAAGGPDAATANALEAAARRARARSAYAAASAAFEEAARLSEEAEVRATRLTSSAQNAWLAGRAEHAIELLDRASATAKGTALRSDIEGLLGHIATRRGRVDEGQRLLVSAATSIQGTDRTKAIRFLGDACISAWGFGHPEKRLDAARLALGLIKSDDPPEYQALAHVAYGVHAVLSGLGADGPDHMRQSVAMFEAVPAERMDGLLVFAAGLAAIFLREAQAGRDLLERTVVLAREKTPTAALPAILFLIARDAWATERWSISRANYEEGLRVAADTTQSIWQANMLAGLAWLDAYEGREADTREHAAQALEIAQVHHMDFVKAWSATALAQLEIGLARAEAALPHLIECTQVLEEAGINDPDLDPAPDVVDVYVRLGRPEDAKRALAAYLPTARAKGQPFALARAARAEALLSPDDSMVQAFSRALEFHAQTPDSFERARTELLFGERLRRARRRVDARRQLRAALRTFEQLGAVPWADRALAELKASGETARPRDDSHRLTLTPQELQVALAIAEGRTTREAAAKLYLSPKTIEYHLRNVYAKLEIRSREELAAALRIG